MKAPALGGVLLLAGLGAGLVTVPARLSIESKSQASGAAVRIEEAYGRLPLSFEPNQGQTDARVRFVSRGRGYALFLTGDGAVLSLHGGGPQRRPRTAGPGLLAAGPWAEPGPARPAVTLALRLVNANPGAQLEPLDELPGRSNYFLGNDPSQWRTNVPNYARVRYREVYPGIDLVYYGNGRQLEHDFLVAPGTDPSVIRFAVEGADKVEVDAQGDLVLSTNEGEVRLRRPVVYQEADGVRQEIAGGYTIHANPQSQDVGFQIANYDATRSLVIDPVLVYSTYLGGSGDDSGQGIAVDAAGNAYVTGTTGGNFATANPLQASNGGGDDVFVAKLNAAGSALVYSTYLGGSGTDYGQGIAVDAAGNAYVTGYTASTNFPTANPLQASNAGGVSDAFVAKLNAAGSALVYSTYLGGSSEDWGNGIAVDSAGNAYVTGRTLSTNFPTANPLQASNRGMDDVFVAKLNAAGSALVYSTYLGGSERDCGYGIAVDAAGNAYVTGYTGSINFPTANPLQATLAGGGDVFVAKLNAAGSALVYSTYLGGKSDDQAYGIAVDSSGNAYVTGSATSTNFPTANPLQASNAGNGHVFVAKLNAAGSALVYSTYLGGVSDSTHPGPDGGCGIAVDAAGNAYVIGNTYSTVPTSNPLHPNWDVFVAELNAAGSALVYSTYLGGGSMDSGNGIAVDAAGNAYVTGFIEFQRSSRGHGDYEYDAFIAKLSSSPVPTLTSLSPAGAATGGPAFTLTANGTNFISGSVVRWNGSDRTTTYVSATQLTASIPASDIAAAGAAQVTVFNPAPGGGASNALTFAIAAPNPVPTLTSLSPSSAAPGGPAFTLRVTGTNFISSSGVLWNGSSRSTTFVSSTQLTAAIGGADITAAGTAKHSDLSNCA